MDVRKRSISLDALRAFAILGVVTLHFVGGVNTLDLNPGNRIAVSFVLAITYPSVNLFAMLSGYLKIDRPHHNASIIKIILQTAFWSFMITIICFTLFKNRTIGLIVKNAFPFIGGRLWYITCYVFLFLCVPFLNLLADQLSQLGYKRLLIIIGVLMSLLSTIFFSDLFRVVNNGYSAGWLIYMYLLGGYYKKYGFWDKTHRRKVLLILCISVCAIVASKYILEVLLDIAGATSSKSWYLYYYNSPLTLLNSICIFYLFTIGHWRENGVGKIVTWLSKVSLGIYIIHAHPYVLDQILIGENLKWVSNENPIITIAFSIVSIIGICIGLGLLEEGRMKMFVACGIDRWIDHMGQKLDKVLVLELTEA